MTSSLLLLEQFSIKCRKTKTKVITLANYKGCGAIHCPIKTQSNCTKHRRTCSSKSRLLSVCHWFWFRFWLVEEVARVFLSQSLSAVMQNQIKRKSLSTQVKTALYIEVSISIPRGTDNSGYFVMCRARSHTYRGDLVMCTAQLHSSHWTIYSWM